MRLPPRIVIIIATVVTAVSALFCIIGLASKGWPSGSLFCDDCSKTPGALSVISFILLILTVIAFILLILGVLKYALQYVPFVLLFISTIFLLATFTSYFTDGKSYSYNLIVAAHFFAYIALAVTAYWCGQTNAETA